MNVTFSRVIRISPFEFRQPRTVTEYADAAITVIHSDQNLREF